MEVASSSGPSATRTINRTIRFIWAIVMSAIAVALFIGAIQAFNKSRTNPWINIPFAGSLSNGEIEGQYQWAGEDLSLQWPGTSVPTHIQLNTNQPALLRLEGLTGREERNVAIRMLILAAVILAVAWAITYYQWTHGHLIRLN